MVFNKVVLLLDFKLGVLSELDDSKLEGYLSFSVFGNPLSVNYFLRTKIIATKTDITVRILRISVRTVRVVRSYGAVDWSLEQFQ